jgi:hypothetical protein
MRAGLHLLAMLLVPLGAGSASAQPASPARAMRAAIHPVVSHEEMQAWLRRVPATRDFPPDFTDMLQSEASMFVLEMSTAPGCIPCADLWTKLTAFRRRYGWRVAVIGGQDALLRSGRLGLPWVGHPVAYVRAAGDPHRIVPVAIGTDHSPNLARNVYLAAKILTGVRPAVGVRAMSKFTGIVGLAARPARSGLGKK